MSEFSENYQQNSSPLEDERNWERLPEINERDFAAIEDIGGYYRGVVENPEGKRYEDIWRNINAIYDFTEHAFAKTCVETRAYGKEPNLQHPSEIEEYRISIKYESLPEHKVTRQYNAVISRRTTGADHETLRTIADVVHQYLVHDLHTLPRSPDNVDQCIRIFVRDWKLNHLE